MSTTGVRDYYRTITEQDIAVVARELLGPRVMEEKGALMACDCPHHQSISRRSLHINMDRQAWYCFGCGVGGDILQLNSSSPGRSPRREPRLAGPNRCHERHAPRSPGLAGRTGFPAAFVALRPQTCGDRVARSRASRHEATRGQEMRVQEALLAMESGELCPSSSNASCFFNGAPFSRNRVVVAIARKTFSTPDTQYEQAKYKKLMVHRLSGVSRHNFQVGLAGGHVYGLSGRPTPCRTFLEVLSNLALDRGQACGHLSWLHTKMDKHAVYFNLNNEDCQIVKMSPDGVEVVQNDGTADNVILDCSRKIKPITFIPDADYNESARLLSKLLIENLTCEPQDRYFSISWLSCFLLIDYAGTRPMTRFEGVSGSGKSAASKMISMLLYGAEEQNSGTDAANYADGAQNPATRGSRGSSSSTTSKPGR